MEWARQATAHNTGMVLTLALNYSARTELVDAFRSIVDAAARNGGLHHLEIDEDAVSQHLYTRHLPDPDLVIRTSGEMRLSNSCCGNWLTLKSMSPDFVFEFREASSGRHNEYQKKERRYGGLAGDATRQRRSSSPIESRAIWSSPQSSATQPPVKDRPG
jgi:undecaprenyl diphosphate synthase